MSVSAVNFGTTPAASFVVNSATQITAVAPAGTGTVNVRVVTSQGTSANAAANQFTYTAAPVPTITNLSPNNGSAAGGTSVVITGTNLTGATAVQFGATAATSFTVNSATQITATSPAGSGAQNVTVTTPNGTSGALTFTYAAALTAPVITSANTANATEGTAFSYTITASGNPTPAIATGFNATGLPAWLTRTNNVVSGTPPAGSGNSSATFTVTATNSEGTSPGVLVTVAIAEPSAGWTITYTFPNVPVGITPGSGGSIPLVNWTGYNAQVAADLTDAIYDYPTQASLPIQLYAKMSINADFVQVPFDSFTNVLSGGNRMWEWGWWNPNIVLTGSNSTSQPILLELRKA